MKLLTLPGLIDPHVHLREPGETHKEDVTTGTAAAIAGGYTTVLDMPNNLTPVLTVKELRRKKKVAQQKTLCNIGFYFGSLGDNLAEFPAAVTLGVFGLKLYLNHTTGDYVLKPRDLSRIFKAWPADLPILLHAEEETFSDILTILRKNPRRIHLCHLSTRYELEHVMTAKNEGLPVTCGVTPHHLFLSRADEKELGAFAKMRPPLRSSRDVTYLWKHLAAIDCIESDHAPHTRAEKGRVPTPSGIPGLETTLPLLLTAVHEGRLELHDVVRLCHDGPARIFNVRQGKGTYIEVDLERTYTIDNKKLFTKAGWTPFHGRKVRGRVLRTVINERPVYKNGMILTPAGSGAVL